MILPYAIAKAGPRQGEPNDTAVRSVLDPAQPIPPGAIWIDMVEPTASEDRKVEIFVGAAAPSKAEPDYTEPPEAQYAEGAVRYMHASIVSETGRLALWFWRRSCHTCSSGGSGGFDPLTPREETCPRRRSRR